MKYYLQFSWGLNTLRLGDTYIHQQIRPLLVQISRKPLSEPVMASGWLDPWEQLLVIFESSDSHSLTKRCIWERQLQTDMYCLALSYGYVWMATLALLTSCLILIGLERRILELANFWVTMCSRQTRITRHFLHWSLVSPNNNIRYQHMVCEG